MTPSEQISVELEAALLKALRATWHDLNASFFRRALAPPQFALTDSRARLGQWSPAERTLALSRALVVEQPWGIVVEVLKHEMAHQFVHEVMGVTDETAHGPAFRTLCERLAIDGSAHGMPRAASGAQGPSSGTVGASLGSDAARMLARVAKLLALAESPERHEAEAAMAAAQRLMLKYNLEAPAPTATTGYAFRQLGRPTGRTNEAERVIAVILQAHFFVEVIWVPVWRVLEGQRGSVLEICGTPENLEMASYVHDFLLRSAEGLWREYKKARRLDGDRDRRAYVAGVMTGFQEKLIATRVETRREGLVWVPDAHLHSFYRRRHPRIRHTRHATSHGSDSHNDGKAAGQALVLHRPVTGGGGGSRRLLLE